MDDNLEKFPIYAGFAARIYDDMAGKILEVAYGVPEAVIEGHIRKAVFEPLYLAFSARAEELKRIANGSD